jgi:hemerythrin superfamily protein
MIDIIGLFNLRRESQSEESSELIKIYINPYYKELLAHDSSQYTNFYQRITPDDNYNFYSKEEIQSTVL